MKIYIAGPMTGLPEFNFPAFDKAAALLRNMDHEVVNPADISRALGLDSPVEKFLREDFKQLMDCDAIYMLPGWAGSRFAPLEMYLATQLKLKVFATAGELIADTCRYYDGDLQRRIYDLDHDVF